MRCKFSAAETAEPNLGHIVENLRVQWALHESPLLRGVTAVHSALAGLEIDADSARVTLADGRRLSCQLVIGADGGQSVARQLAGIGRSGWTYEQTAVVAHLQPERPHRTTAWQRFLPAGPLALLPLQDGRVSLVWSTTPAEADALLAMDAAEFGERVSVASDHVLGRLALASAPRRVSARALACPRLRPAAARAGGRCGAHDSSAGGAGRQPGLPRLREPRAGAGRGRRPGRGAARPACPASLRTVAAQRECRRAWVSATRSTACSPRRASRWPPSAAWVCRWSRASRCCAAR